MRPNFTDGNDVTMSDAQHARDLPAKPVSIAQDLETSGHQTTETPRAWLSAVRLKVGGKQLADPEVQTSGCPRPPTTSSIQRLRAPSPDVTSSSVRPNVVGMRGARPSKSRSRALFHLRVIRSLVRHPSPLGTITTQRIPPSCRPGASALTFARTSILRSSQCRGAGRRDHRQSLLSRVDMALATMLCLSGGLHAALIGAMVWITLAELLGPVSVAGPSMNVSLVSVSDSWRSKTIPPPLNPTSVDQRSKTAHLSRPRGLSPGLPSTKTPAFKQKSGIRLPSVAIQPSSLPSEQPSTKSHAGLVAAAVPLSEGHELFPASELTEARWDKMEDNQREASGTASLLRSTTNESNGSLMTENPSPGRGRTLDPPRNSQPFADGGIAAKVLPDTGSLPHVAARSNFDLPGSKVRAPTAVSPAESNLDPIRAGASSPVASVNPRQILPSAHSEVASRSSDKATRPLPAPILSVKPMEPSNQNPPSAPLGKQDAISDSNATRQPVATGQIGRVGLSGVGIHIERPYAGVTAQGVHTLAGRVAGSGAKGIVVSLNGGEQLLDVWGTMFEGEVSLQPGNNRIRVVAMGNNGALGESSVEVHYSPPVSSPTIRIIRPGDGTVLDLPEPDVIQVEGELTGTFRNPVRVAFNEFAIPASIKDGRFSAALPVIGPEIRIWAEASGEGESLRSETATVQHRAWKPTRGYVFLHLPTRIKKIEARVLVSYRANPGDPNAPRKVDALQPLGSIEGVPMSAIFAFSQTQSGVYAMGLDYRIPAGESVEGGWGLVFIPGPNGYRTLHLGPFQLDGKGRVALGKFLAPQGVFWEEDSWFTGIAEGADTFTKFRYSDGISWTERRGEPEFSIPK